MFYPGSFFDETSIEEVPDRNTGTNIPDGISKHIDSRCFGFRFHTQDVLIVEDKEFSTKKYDYSQLFYIGIKYSLEEVKTKFGEHDILISNMESNNIDYIVKTRCGNFKPLNGDEIILNYSKNTNEFFYDESFDEYKI